MDSCRPVRFFLNSQERHLKFHFGTVWIPRLNLRPCVGACFGARCVALRLLSFSRLRMSEDSKHRLGQGVIMESAHLEIRRETRYPLQVEIQVSRVDATGAVVHERTCTRNISKWGCAFLSSVERRIGDIIMIQLLSGTAEKRAQQGSTMFEVVRVEREKDGWFVGAWRLGGEWEIDFESAAKAEPGSLEARRPGSRKNK